MFSPGMFARISLFPIFNGTTQQRFDGLEFMDPLIKDMVQDDPKKRPTMDEVVKRFADIRRRLSRWTLRSRLYTKDENRRVRMYRSTRHVFRTIGYLATFRSAIPSPRS